MASDTRTNQDSWWRGACLYEVYLRSFQDSDGDGEGDLKGLVARLGYLAQLGVDGIWITPFFPSPMFDSGYDVADYRQVDPRYGTLDDFLEVVNTAHELGLKVIIDQVYSHSSHLHPWFSMSRSSRDNPKADWYVWADPKPDGSLPNNWLARFGGVAWEWAAERRQYYLHNFLAEQPDLNMRNTRVQDEFLDIMRFWFGLGVDGLRLDVANFFMHDSELRDNPPAKLTETPANPYYMQQRLYDRSRPENLPFLERMRKVAGERMLLAEISCDWQVERMAEYTAPGRLHTAYSFALLAPELDGNVVADAVEQAGHGDSWPTWAFSNHDVIRVASRWNAAGNPGKITMLHALLVCLRGTVIIYQGEELGLGHGNVPREKLRDPEAIRFWPLDRRRDGARTPFPWDDSPSLGFSRAEEPWLPCDPAHAELSVAKQNSAPGSVLAKCRELIALRKACPVLRLGEFEVVDQGRDRLIFRRTFEGKRLLCAFNFGNPALDLSKYGLPTTLSGEARGGVLSPGSYLIAEEN
ncbi:MAG: alpha glucosidase [Albidovulum sp.]|nr:alpha glucosidase [Albidovulum sp.]